MQLKRFSSQRSGKIIYPGGYTNGQYTASEFAAFCQRIDPRNRIVEVTVFFERLQHLLQVFHLDGLLTEVSCFNFTQSDLRTDDHTKQAKTAKTCFKQICIFFTRGSNHRAVCQHDPERKHTVEERSVHVVCLTVNIISDGATDSNEFCSRTDHRQPAFRSENVDDLLKTHPGFTFKDAVLLVPPKKMVEMGADNDLAILVDCLISIAAAQSPGSQVALLYRLKDFCFRRWICIVRS